MHFIIEQQGMVFPGRIKSRFFSVIERDIEESVGNKALCAKQIYKSGEKILKLFTIYGMTKFGFGGALVNKLKIK